MESETNSLLNVPITDAEHRRRRNSPDANNSARAQGSLPAISQHERDRQYNPHVGRFSSLRHPGERYDDPEQQRQPYQRNTRRPSSLPEIDEESHYSDHDDEEPIVRPSRTNTLSRSAKSDYVAIPDTLHHGHHEHEHDITSTPPAFWQPIWLKKFSLIGMALLLALLIVGLVVVCNNADNSDGYHISSSTQHYAWTYAPTLVMVIVVGLWHQINYHTRVLMPWKALALGPESPFETVLVDYISDFQVASLITAFKRLHVPVLITIVAFCIAKALTIASTGLFYTQERIFTDGFPTVLNSSFDAAALDPSILNAGAFPNTSIYTYVQSEVNGLGLQPGIASGFAYIIPAPKTDSKPLPSNATFNATVDTFVPLISCRAANVTVAGETTIQTLDFPYNSTETVYGSPSDITLNINEADICASWPSLNFSALDPLHYIVPTQTLESRSQEILCDGGENSNPILLLTMLEIEYTQTLLTNVTREEGGDLPIALDTSRSVSRLVSVLCQADYTISQVNVTNDTAINGAAALSLTPIDNAANRTLDGLTPANMTTIYSTMLNSDAGLFADTTSDDTFVRTPAFDLLAWTATNGSYDNLFDASKLADAAEKIYFGAMPVFAAKNLVSTASDNSARTGPIASIAWQEERLFTNWTPVIIVLAGLGIMLVLTVALIILLPENVVPRDPNSIAATATFLTRSIELNRLLRKLQSPRNKGIAAALNGYEVGTAIAIDESNGAKSFKIHVTEGRPQRDVEEITPNIKFWDPIWAGLPVFVGTFISPLVLIATLEYLQQRSDTNRGLWTVPDDRGTLIGSHFVPAFVTLLIAGVVNNLDFYIVLFTPWATLFAANAPPTRSILKDYLSHNPLSRLAISGTTRQWGALMSTLATIFASLLTVIISGLYIVDSFDTIGPTRGLARLDNFNFNLITSYSVDNDNGAGAMFDLIQQNSSFPQGTLDEYAFPRISLQDLSTPLSSGSSLAGPMMATLPGYRATLNCNAPTSYDVSTVDSAVRVSASYDVSESCRNGVDSLDGPTVSFNIDFSPNDGAVEFGGRLFDLRFGANSSQHGRLGEGDSSSVGDNPAVGCPSLVFVWGNFELGNDDLSAVNVAICYQKIENVNANLTIQQNTTQLGPRPPMPDENTVRAENNPNGTDIFDFRIQRNIERQLGDFAGSNPNVDAFFHSIFNGRNPTDLTNFTSSRDAGLTWIQYNYRLYMAQVINAMLREPVIGTGTKLLARQQTNLQEARTIVTTTRLVQDKISKIILQVFLGLTALLILGGYINTKMRNILPCNPCSIAGAMSLLAGSDMCYSPDDGICECCGKVRRSFRNPEGGVEIETIHADDNEHADNERAQLIRPGAEWMDDNTFARIFAGRTYSLGWWEPNPKLQKTKRYGVDYGHAPSGNDTGDWYLGNRKSSGNFEIFSEQIQEGRGRSRALSDVNERGSYQRAGEPSPGVEAHEMRNLAPRGPGAEARYGDA